MKTSCAVALGLLLVSGCAEDTECDYVTKEPTGQLASDIVGCWQTFGLDTLVVYQFNPDGNYRYIEPPGEFLGAGRTVTESYTLSGDVLNMGDGTPTRAEVTRTTLRLYDYEMNLRRAVCTGYGFDPGQACP
jgi:hypothetical protein